MKSRYCYNPMTAKRIGRRVTLMDRIRRALAISRNGKPDMYEVIGYCAPVLPAKK